MGALKGTLTYMTYYLVEEPGVGFRETFMEALQKRVFRDIDVDAGKDHALGWVGMGAPFETELTWDKVFRDPYVCVSLREDTIRIPKTAFQAHFERRLKEFAQAEGRDVLKKSEKADVKASVLANLRRRALPDIRTYDVVWNTVDGSIRIWTHNKRINETFQDLAREDWGIRIVPRSPYTALTARNEDPALGAALLDLEPADLVGIGD